MSTSPIVTAMALAAGVIYGAMIAVVPTVVGGFVVVVVLIRRHPHPASFEGVHRDLGLIFGSVVLGLDLVVLVWWVVLGGWTSQVLVVLLVLLVIDAAAAAVLHPARTSIARTWVEASDRVGVVAGGPHHLGR